MSVPHEVEIVNARVGLDDELYALCEALLLAAEKRISPENMEKFKGDVGGEQGFILGEAFSYLFCAVLRNPERKSNAHSFSCAFASGVSTAENYLWDLNATLFPALPQRLAQILETASMQRGLTQPSGGLN